MSSQISNASDVPSPVVHNPTTGTASVAAGRKMSKRKRRSFFGVSKSRIVTEAPKDQSQDWPNAIGFKFHQDVTTPVQLQVIGTLPEYVRGTLYRIGPGGHEVETENKGSISLDHWFDGLSQIHRFHIIDSNTITYNSRHTCDSLIESYRREGNIGNRYSFGQGRDPCKSIFSKFMSVFRANKEESSPSDTNIGVTITADFPGLPSTASGGEINNLYAQTDNAGLQELHPETLEPIGLGNQTWLHHLLKGPLSAAHSITCPETGDVFNYNLTVGKHPTYRVFKVYKCGKAVVLATIRDAPPAYLHSFFLTKKYLILCVWNSHLAYRGSALLWEKNIIDAIAPFDASKKARWYVIDRTSYQDGILGVYESEPFFAFHTINAWDEPREDGLDDVICEVTAFDNLDVIKKFYFHNLLGNSKQAEPWLLKREPRATRWKLTAIRSQEFPDEAIIDKIVPGFSCGFRIEEAIKVHVAGPEHNFELGTINPNYMFKPHRYTYGLNTLGASTLHESIIKYDSLTHTSISWTKEGHTPGEAIFIPNPKSTGDGAEDDGVLLSVVLDGHMGKSYLLCLRARDLHELSRAQMDTVVSLGFHGKFVGKKKVVVEGKGANDTGWAEW